MVTIKSFAPGQKAYMTAQPTNMDARDDKPVEVQETVVKKTGRLYVYASDSRKYEMQDHCKEALVEAKDWGERNLLFPTREAAEKYWEKAKLLYWFEELKRKDLKKCTLEELVAARRILEGEDKSLLNLVSKLINQYRGFLIEPEEGEMDEYKHGTADTLSAVIHDLNDCLKN